MRTYIVAKRAGFTLIELALVALLVLTLIGFSAPILRRSISSLALKDSSYRIVKLMDYAQEKAIMDGRNFKLVLDSENDRYRLFEFDESLEPPAYKPISGRFGRALVLPQNISLKSSKAEIVFYPDGRCDEASVDVFDSKGDGYRIHLKGFAARVEIKEIANEK